MVDVDVTQEILNLSQGGVEALKELLKVAGIILMPVNRAAMKLGKRAWDKVKDEVFTPKGVVNHKDFRKVSEGREIVSIKLTNPVDIELLNESMKKFDIAVYLEEGPDVTQVSYTKDKMIYINSALKDYEEKLAEKVKLREQYSEEKEDMTESQAANVRENNRTADELFFTDAERKQPVPFMNSILDEEKKEKIHEAQLHVHQQNDTMSASEVKQTLNPPEGLSGKDVHIGEENKSLNQVLNKIRLTGDVMQDRAGIAERIRAEISEEADFVSLRNDKTLCFRDNDDHLVVMNLEDYTMKVSDLSGLPEEEKERVSNLIKVISEQRKNVETDLDTTLPQDFSLERKKFVQEMYEYCILHTEVSRQDVNAVRNFMTLKEENKKELTWKDVLLWEAAKNGQFEYSMIKLDVEQIENVLAAKASGMPDKFIQHMIRYEFSADQMRGTIALLSNQQDVSIEEIDGHANEIEGRQEKIKETLVRGYTENEKEQKQSFADTKDKIADAKLKYMETDKQALGQAAEYVTEGKDPDHEDENGKWFEAYKNAQGNRVFVNEGKTEIKYEVRIDGEALPSDQKNRLEKQGACYQDGKGVKYYKNKDNLVSENGKVVKQKRVPYQAQMQKPMQKEAGEAVKKAEKTADKGR